MLEQIRTLVYSMFSKKFVAFIAIAIPLIKERQWTELLGAFGVYCGAEVVDKKVPNSGPPPGSTPEEFIED